MANTESTTEIKEIKICMRCGNPFTPEGEEDFCWTCRNSRDVKEEEIIDYLRKHPGVSILEVSQVTKLSKKVLLRMAHEGRFKGLQLNKDFGYPCGHCGKLITFGTYCPECFESLKKDAKNAKNASFMAKARKAQKSKEAAKAAEDEKGRTFSTGMQDEIKSRIKK